MAGATNDRALVCKVLPYMVLLGNQRRRRKNAEKMPLFPPFFLSYKMQIRVDIDYFYHLSLHPCFGKKTNKNKHFCVVCVQMSVQRMQAYVNNYD
jgi:hypothetical protein